MDCYFNSKSVEKAEDITEVKKYGCIIMQIHIHV